MKIFLIYLLTFTALFGQDLKPLPNPEYGLHITIEEVNAGKSYQIDTFYFTKEIIEQLTNNLNPNNDKELLRILNAFDANDLKTMLIGKDHDLSLTRFPGALEVKRKYKNPDEHLEIMTTDGFNIEKNFENISFIPTGYIRLTLENGDQTFIEAKSLIDKKVEFDLNKMQIVILKNTLIYYLKDLSKLEESDLTLLNKATELAYCSHNCSNPLKDTHLGDLILDVIKIQNSSDESSDNKLTNLIELYESFCGTVDTKQPLLSREEISGFFEISIRYPEISFQKYIQILNKVKDYKLVPYVSLNSNLEINDSFLKLSNEAYKHGLLPTGLKDYLELIREFPKLSIVEYVDILAKHNSTSSLKKYLKSIYKQ